MFCVVCGDGFYRDTTKHNIKSTICVFRVAFVFIFVSHFFICVNDGASCDEYIVYIERMYTLYVVGTSYYEPKLDVGKKLKKYVISNSTRCWYKIKMIDSPFILSEISKNAQLPAISF